MRFDETQWLSYIVKNLVQADACVQRNTRGWGHLEQIKIGIRKFGQSQYRDKVDERVYGNWKHFC